MQVKFKAPDPRAGLTAQMDSHRGQQLIDAGAAVLLKENGSEQKAEKQAPANSVKPVTTKPAAKPAAKTKK